MVKNLHEKVSFEKVMPQYEKLLMLKKALMLGESEEVNEKILLERSREHNLREIYLVGYLVDVVLKAPKEVREQNDLLISCYDKPKEFAKAQKQSENLFKTNPKFRRYFANIFSYLDLFAPMNRVITNMTIFGLCPEIISTSVPLESKNVILNFHILQKWLSEQRKVDFSLLSDIEKKVVLYLANGYSVEEIVEDDVIEGDYDDKRLQTVLYELLPARCNVQSVCQVMAVMFMSNPELNDIYKAMDMLEDLLENGEFWMIFCTKFLSLMMFSSCLLCWKVFYVIAGFLSQNYAFASLERLGNYILAHGWNLFSAPLFRFWLQKLHFFETIEQIFLRSFQPQAWNSDWVPFREELLQFRFWAIWLRDFCRGFAEVFLLKICSFYGL